MNSTKRTIAVMGATDSCLRKRSSWSEADISDLHGRTAVVTGANTGLGFQTARMLAGHGATVILACRNTVKAQAAADRIRDVAPGARVRTMPLDLASLASIRETAAWLRGEYQHLDLLINNAGGINPRYRRTEDGFETTLATNHLGPFAFTGLVLDLLLAAPQSRIVTVSSVGHRRGTINFDDLYFERGYRYRHAYFQSKLANLMFTYELQRRLASAGSATIALAAHPGNARTEFGRDMSAFVRVMMNPRLRPLTFWLMQPAEAGVLPITRAATDPGARGGEYYGPDGWNEWTGSPVRVESIPSSHDADAQRRLWQLSEQLTSVTYHIGTTSDQRS
jgi:NAD(P)-dependent dehydrogenase (short-subunit alcohol dehydrogenase family)